MNTRDLQYFQALTKIKSFSQVAANFHVTQPTISMAVKRLESHFGIQLIDRDQSHGVIKITPAGEQLAGHVQVIIAELTAAEAELARARSSKIRLGLPPIIGNFYFPKLAPQLVAADLMQHLQPLEKGSANLLEALRAGSLDLGLLGSSGPLDAPALKVQPLTASPFTIVVPPDHPLAHKPAVTFAEVADEPFVTLTEGFVHTKAFAWFTHASGVQPSIVYRTADVTLLKRMIQTHVGIALLAQMAVLPSDNLVAVPIIAANQPAFDIALVAGKNAAPTPELTQLTQILLAAAKGETHAHRK
ncbi:LysR family transcriptional regulator [Lacticaseibacillus salsurivasis]|uniref:LysR family transcriptional regulator n=1 Tax=Lacticaseibacillus salsurivasis TaxID=3081441 RepID=UPI0030C77352